MAFRYGKGDVRTAVFERPRPVDLDRGRAEEVSRLDRPRELSERDRRDREVERFDRRRGPRSRTRSRSPRRFERRRSPERDRDHDRDRFRERELERDRERRSPGRERERRERLERERPLDRGREREVEHVRERSSPSRERIDRMRDTERLPIAVPYGGFNGPPGPSFNGLSRGSGFGPSPGFTAGGPAMPGFNDVCFVCGGVGHFGRDCPSNPEDLSKLRLPGRRGSDVDMGDPNGRNKGLPPDDPNFPKCFECGKRGHVARECRLKQAGAGPIEQRCYNCGSIGHIARDCPNRNAADGPLPPHHVDMPPPSGPPRAAPGGVISGEACYNCGRPGHFARECPAKFGPPAMGPSPIMDRWLGGMPRPGPMGRGMGFGGMGFSTLGFGGVGPGGMSAGAAEGCYECGHMGHFARECPVRSRRLAERAAAAAHAGGGAGGSGGEGRRIASSAIRHSAGGGRAEEAKLNNELEDYMKKRSHHRRDGDDDRLDDLEDEPFDHPKDDGPGSDDGGHGRDQEGGNNGARTVAAGKNLKGGAEEDPEEAEGEGISGDVYAGEDRDDDAVDVDI